MHCMLQSTTLTPLRAPIPAISHFNLFGFRLAIFGNLLKIFKISITDICFFNKERACFYEILNSENKKAFLI